MSTKRVLFAKKFCKESNWLLKCPLCIDFKYCVILVYRLEESDRTVCEQVTYGFHTNCVGLSVLSLLKKC